MNIPDSKLDKQRGAEQNAAPTPPTIDAVALAHLVAQSRFTTLPNKEAIDAALHLLHDCQSSLEKSARPQSKAEIASKEFEKPPMPEKFPATLDDFYRLIVKGKKKADNQPRFRKFLSWQIDAAESAKIFNLNDIRMRLARLEEQITDAAKRGVILVQASVPGSLSPKETAELLKKSIVQQESSLLDAKQRERLLDARFTLYSTDGIDDLTWHICSEEYPRWWLPEKTAKKKAAGRARAAKEYEAKKRAKRAIPAS
ncbi:MAG TPA: hypothetical protein VGO59_09160 [Verrucomicrobiae bacterium]|jgi:hypothetical protein